MVEARQYEYTKPILERLKNHTWYFHHALAGGRTTESQLWDEEQFSMLGNERARIPERALPLQLSVFDALGDIRSNSAIIDWGTGEAPYYPLFHPASHPKVYAIEPSSFITESAINAGRLPRSTTIIQRSEPPYDAIPEKSASGAVAISTLHLISEELLVSVIGDLHSRLIDGRPIVILQDVSPGYRYLRDLSFDRLRKIEAYIKEKYQLGGWNLNHIPNDGGWLAQYHDKSVRHILSRISWWFHVQGDTAYAVQPDEHMNSVNIGDPKLVWNKTPFVFSEVAKYIQASSRIRTEVRGMDHIFASKLKDEIKKFHLPGIRGMTHAIYKFASWIHELPPEIISAAHLSDWVAMLTGVFGHLQQDIYEAYLVTALADQGYQVFADQPATFTVTDTPEQSEDLISIDGHEIRQPTPYPVSRTIASIRRVVVR